MKQPTDQRKRNEDKKKPEENPSRGIDPKPEEEKEMEEDLLVILQERIHEHRIQYDRD